MPAKMTFNIHSKSLLLIPVVGLILFLFPVDVRESLYFNIEAISQGEYWRFFTGHFLFFSYNHLLFNSIALLIYVLIFNSTITKYIFLEIALLATIISTGLIFLSNQLSGYIGFSGILFGLYILSAIKYIPTNKRLAYSVLAILSLYIANQLFKGELIESSIYDIRTSTYAHALGYFGGILLATVYRLTNNDANRKNP